MSRKRLTITLLLVAALALAGGLSVYFLAIHDGSGNPGAPGIRETGEIEKRVVELRGLSLLEPVEFQMKTESELAELEKKEEEEEYTEEELEADQKFHEALGLVEPGAWDEETDDTGPTGDTAGYYDVEDKKITLIKGTDMDSVEEEVTIAHEFTHALQDQHFHLDRPPLEIEGMNSDSFLASLSLVEGDATSVEIEYGRKFLDYTPEQAPPEMDESGEQYDDDYFMKLQYFPYEEGLAFVSALKRNGGNDALDNAFKSPPVSSEQILHPEKFLENRDAPRKVDVPDLSQTLGSSWKLLKQDTLGEFNVWAWFDEFTGPSTSKNVAAGWGGNTAEYFEGTANDFVFVNSFCWDTAPDAEEFFNGYAELIDGRFYGNARLVVDEPSRKLWQAEGRLFFCGIDESDTLCVQAADRGTLDLVLSSFENHSLTQIQPVLIAV